ncbi:MAG: hypothetical protein QOK21_2857 [Solirubrobacteraceae bacterium]|nr:hypothetical protein [Solirubrobacteraceae bacterium]
MKAIFTPISIGIGLGAGILARKLFDAIWGVIDDEDAPNPKHREIDYGKLVAALLLEGAIVRVVRGFVDHGLRHGFARTTGSWPGEERPEPQ